ncbi:TPA: hypothetical protein NJ269_004462 [Vibrio parahaemolyticus]|nr:hypothetical protein [Vibrio parahaemolyticus]
MAKLCSAYRKCDKYYEHNRFLGVLDNTPQKEVDLQKLLNSISDDNRCEKCSNHIVPIDSDYVPASQFKLTGELKTKKYRNLGILMIAIGFIIPSATVVWKIITDSFLLDQNFANYVAAISVYLVAAGVMAEMNSSNIARFMALIAALVSIFSFSLNAYISLEEKLKQLRCVEQQHNNLFKSDSQRVAFLQCVEISD